jgi:thiol-disulfide isomerase/thioredoxin
MTRRIIGLAGWLACVPWLAAEDIKLPVLRDGGTVYTNVVVTTVTPTEIYFRHNGGMGNLKLRYLEPDLQKRFNYNPETAESTPAPTARAAATIPEAQPVYQPPWFHAQPAASVPDASPTDAANTAASAANPFGDPVSDTSPVNKPAPDITVEKWFSEKPPATAGKCAVILFWSSQSEACRRAIAQLNALQKKYAADLTVIGITSETEREVSQMSDPIEFAYGSDTKAITSRAVGATSVPCVLVVDPKGIVRYLGHPAAITSEALEKYFAR